jgi:Fe2+ or Zn2+ uptake regulation protein
MSEAPIRDLLGTHGLRCTAQRELIYSTLMASKVHPTAEELHNTLSRMNDSGGISLATVYNALDAFTRHGLARRIAPTCGGSSAAFRYDADISDHAHAVMADGSMHDLPEDLSKRVIAQLPRELIDEVERRMGMRIHRVGVEFVEAPKAE